MTKAKRRTHGGLPPETEILTAGGWRKIYDITRSDEVLVWSPDSGWKPKSQIRKSVIPSAIWAWEILTAVNVFVIGEGEPLLTTTGNRTVGAKWPMSKVYTTYMGSPQTKMAESALVIMLATLSHGIIDESGYSIRVKDESVRKVLTAAIGRRGVVSEDGWEKWVGVINTPRLRGTNLQLDGLCPYHAPLLRNAYRLLIGCSPISKHNAEVLQRYFITSGVGCSLVAAGRFRGCLLFHDHGIEEVHGTTRRKVKRLFKLSGAAGKILIRQKGVPLVAYIHG